MPPDLTSGDNRNPRWLPGLLPVVAIAGAALIGVGVLAQAPEPLSRLPVSPILLAIMLGLAFSASAQRHPDWNAGLILAAGPLLKLGVMLIGLRLSLTQLGILGAQAIPLVVGAILTGLGLALSLGRLFGVGRKLTALLAVGSAICGASAIAATAPALRSRPEETAYALACITLFGLVATLVYPWLLEAWLGDAHLVGLMLGATVHDTAQVTAAAVLHEQTFGVDVTVAAATVTKLLRNLAMMIVIPWIIWWGLRGERESAAELRFPLFVLGFVGFAALRSAGDWLVADTGWWQAVIRAGEDASAFLFAMAMAAIGMQLRLDALRSLGAGPALVAGLTAVGMGGVAFLLVRVLG